MPRITNTGRGVVVVVDRKRQLATVSPNPTTVAIPQRAHVNTVRDVARTVAMTGAGPKGAKGDPGGTSEDRIARSTGAGSCGYASADNPLHGDDTIGLTTGAASAGDTVSVQRFGPISFNGWDWTPGNAVYLANNGLMTQTPPDSGFLQIVGHAESPTSLFLSLNPCIRFVE
jgi:hypothetical protein